MSASHHFDVVCIGFSPALLAAAALLARRTFRVLVVGEGHRPSTYHYEGYALARRRAAPIGLDTPVFSRMRVELGEAATWRRRSEQLDPMFRLQWAERAGLSVPPSLERFLNELDVVVPGERATAASFYPELAEYNAFVDALLEDPAQLFGEGLLAGRRRDKLLRELGALHARVKSEPRDPIASSMRALVQKATQALEVPPLAAARIYGSWTRGITRMLGDDDALSTLLLDKVRASGGTVAEDAHVLSIETQGKRVTAVTLDDARPAVSCGFVLTTLPIRAVLRKTAKYAPDTRALAAAYLPKVVKHRVTVSFVVPARLVPLAFAEETLLCTPGNLPVLLQVRRVGEAHEEGAYALLYARADLPPAEVPECRERIVQLVARHVPKLARAALVIDCVQDAGDLWDQRSGKRVPVPRQALRDRAAQSGPAEPIYELDGDDPFAGERLERLLRNARIVGPTALPALGVEGELAAAAYATQLITKSDRVREKMRRELWSKLELES